MEKNGIWITWEFQRRNYGISSALGWPLNEFDFNSPRLIRYLKSIYKSINVIYHDKPTVVAAQNPSIILAITAILICKLFGKGIIIDAHNSGIYPCEGKNPFLLSIAKWIQKKSDLTIVTNNELKKVVESNGGRAFVLPDRIPEVNNIKRIPLEGRHAIAYICSFSDDEPYLNVIEAAKLLPPDIKIYITGKYYDRLKGKKIPENVILLGYISDEKYWSLLKSADIIMDLTLRENCLVCGAYEAVAIAQPLILSNTKALKAYFNRGCIYVGSSVASIAKGMICAVDQLDSLKSEIAELRSIRMRDWENMLILLKGEIRKVVGRKNFK